MQEVYGFKHWEPGMIHRHILKLQQNLSMNVTYASAQLQEAATSLGVRRGVKRAFSPPGNWD